VKLPCVDEGALEKENLDLLLEVGVGGGDDENAGEEAAEDPDPSGLFTLVEFHGANLLRNSKRKVKTPKSTSYHP